MVWGVLGESRCTQQRGGSSDTPLSTPPRPHEGHHKPGLSSRPPPQDPQFTAPNVTRGRAGREQCPRRCWAPTPRTKDTPFVTPPRPQPGFWGAARGSRGAKVLPYAGVAGRVRCLWGLAHAGGGGPRQAPPVSKHRRGPKVHGDVERSEEPTSIFWQVASTLNGDVKE